MGVYRTRRNQNETRSALDHLPVRLPGEKIPAVAGIPRKPTPGLEPGTPSLRMKCSTN